MTTQTIAFRPSPARLTLYPYTAKESRGNGNADTAAVWSGSRQVPLSDLEARLAAFSSDVPASRPLVKRQSDAAALITGKPAEALMGSGTSDMTRYQALMAVKGQHSPQWHRSRAVGLASQCTDPAAYEKLLLQAPGDYIDEKTRMARTLGKADADPAEKARAARLVSTPRFHRLPEDCRKLTVDYVKQHGDLETRKALLKQMDDGPLGAATMERVGAATQAAIIKELSSSKDPEQKNLAGLLRAKGMLAGEFKERALPGRAQEVERNIAAMNKKESIQKFYRETSQKAAAKEFAGLGTEHARFMTSDAFLDRLEVAGPELAGDVLKLEAGKLELLAPELRAATIDKLSRRMIERKGAAAFDAMTPEQRQTVVTRALEAVSKDGSLPGVIEKAGSTADLASDVANVLKLSSENGGAFDLQVQAMKDKVQRHQAARAAGITPPPHLGDLGRMEKAIGVLDALDKNGKLGAFSAAVNIASLVTSENAFKDAESALNSSKTLVEIAGSANDLAEVSGWLAAKAGARGAEGLTRTGEALGKKTMFKALGPLGDAFGMVDQGSKMFTQFGSGHSGAAMVSAAATLGYGGAAGVGVYAICVGSGPLGWTALGLGLLATGISGAVGESDNEAFLRREVKGHLNHIIPCIP